MRSFSILFAFFIFGLSSQVSGQVVLDIELRTIDGEYTTISDLSGDRLTVLDFWATWCKPCMKSIPKLIELSDQYEESVVQFLGINIDSPRNLSKVSPLARTLDIPYPVLLDTEQELYNELLVASLPTLIVLDAYGEIVYVHEGFATGDETVIREELANLLAE